MNSRDVYIQKAKAKLEKLNAEIGGLEASTKELSADAEIKRREALKLLRQKLEEAENRIEAVQSSNEDAWDDIKQGFEAAWDDVAGAFEQAHKHY